MAAPARRHMDDRLLDAVQKALDRTVRRGAIGVAFSGGVDSTLMARICSKMGYDVTLLTVGFAGSHDIAFAGEVRRHLRLPHETLTIDAACFGQVADSVQNIIKTDNLSWIENAIAFHYLAVLARRCGIDVVVTANGIDELFCGYSAYRDAVALGEKHILEMIESKLQNELAMMQAIGPVVEQHGVRVVQPLLLPEFAAYARSVPLQEKIHGPDDLMRKHAIRKLALDVGAPEISAHKRKKALQYGSLIHKALVRSRRAAR